MRTFFILLVIILTSTMAHADVQAPGMSSTATVTLSWQPNGASPDGYQVYQRVNNAPYDYSNPVSDKIISHNIPDGNIPANVTQVTIDGLGLEGLVRKYSYVVRAMLGDEISEDSNEVSITIDNSSSPLTPPELFGNYDSDGKVVILSWDPQEHTTANHWGIYYKEPGAAEYTEFATVSNDASASPSMTTDIFSLVQPRETATFVFVVVSFDTQGNHSADSEPLEIEIDRSQEVPASNVKVAIPVE